ncbi:MAG: PD-(D/E)XK nuclease family protein [Planctomycetota bacterium]
MGKLVNELSWSRSRISTLENCKRQYYYQYYQKWGGWSWDADESAKQSYFFTKMTNLPMLCGHAVHETIKRILEDIRDHGEIRLANPSDYVRRELLSRTWQDAEKELWRKNLKNHPPVFEIYYAGMKPPPAVLKQMGAKASRCVENFLAGNLFQDLKKDDSKRWLAVDEGPSFEEDQKLKLDGRTLWALPDFARENTNGECEIWDWKTGRKNPNDAMQLQSYALFARDRWGYDPDQIRLFGYYLDDKKDFEYECNADTLAAVEERIRRDFRIMESLLSDVASNSPEAPETHFPQIDDLDSCRKCLFKELCGR